MATQKAFQNPPLTVYGPRSMFGSEDLSAYSKGLPPSIGTLIRKLLFKSTGGKDVVSVGGSSEL